MRFLLDMIERFMQPEATKKDISGSTRIGIVRGQDLYDDDYDFDEMNAEIEKMFGVGE